MRLQSFFTDALVSEGKPKLAGFQRHSFVTVLGSLEHVVDDVGHVGQQPVHSDFQQLNDGTANVLSDIRVTIICQEEQTLDEFVDMKH